jgi:hypothetical protein
MLPGPRWLAAAVLLVVPPVAARGQVGNALPYGRRGRAVESHRTALQARIEAARSALLDTLRLRALDLVPRVDPAPPPVPQGYQLLPRLVTDAPQRADTGRRIALYSWPWTDTLIARGEQRVDSLDRALAVAKQRAEYERLIATFNGIVADRRLIDAHVEHNWFWQRAIAADSGRFLRASHAIDSTLRGLLNPVGAPPAIPSVEMTILETIGETIVRVPVETDIEDTTFVRAAQSAVERSWSRRVNDRDYRIALDVRFVRPVDLYCPRRQAGCAPPARGTAIDLPSHVARFPAAFAVLTTGGTQPHVIAGRAMILGPRELSARTLAHEFGHILGFDDAYLRGFRNLGTDGYAILELIPDRTDIMAASGFGEAQSRHLIQLAANLRANTAMKVGLAMMYDRHDPRAAVVFFRQVLSDRPDHYGATFQLAKALDQSGDTTLSVPIWKRMLDLAQAQGDTTTIRAAKRRLGIP